MVLASNNLEHVTDPKDLPRTWANVDCVRGFVLMFAVNHDVGSPHSRVPQMAELPSSSGASFMRCADDRTDARVKKPSNRSLLVNITSTRSSSGHSYSNFGVLARRSPFLPPTKQENEHP